MKNLLFPLNPGDTVFVIPHPGNNIDSANVKYSLLSTTSVYIMDCFVVVVVMFLTKYLKQGKHFVKLHSQDFRLNYFPGDP